MTSPLTYLGCNGNFHLNILPNNTWLQYQLRKHKWSTDPEALFKPKC